MSSNTFEIRTYGKSKFAMLMFPNARDPQQVQDRLLRWIRSMSRYAVWPVRPPTMTTVPHRYDS